MAVFSHRRKKRKLTAEINVVPYIDVKLVLLVIFMITASVMNLGVDVNLPQSNARAVQQSEDPVVVSINAAGQYSLRLGDGPDTPVSAEQLSTQLRAFVAQNPRLPVFVAADKNLRYQEVMTAMELLQAAGVSRAALMSVPRAQER
ncbi:protein TolR [Silanimonas sp.]|uniref:protein TolR n=1 Tax=Silanimonas sp. TaxID=1929290 RepID=UPI001BC51608|nr:protein TolR [Silanimonas sp.]MBS3895304.1 protein TolR [Silanimonas sp.]MBS3923712.1 protein TolR [Xanthomonadaceae bacterium]